MSVPDFDAVYEEQVDFVWRAVRRMGVRLADMDDVVQEVFFIVHRRLVEFEGRAQIKTWVFRILVRVVRPFGAPTSANPETGPPVNRPRCSPWRPILKASPAATLERVEALRILDRLLAELDEDKREVFVLAEIEQMTAGKSRR